MAAPRGDKQRRPDPVSGVHVNRSRPLAPRTRAFVHGPCPPLDEVYRQLRRKPHQDAALATSVVAEAQLSVSTPTEKDQTIAVFAECHEWSSGSGFPGNKIDWRRIGQSVVVDRCPPLSVIVQGSVLQISTPIGQSPFTPETLRQIPSKLEPFTSHATPCRLVGWLNRVG